ncbi:hypothetical protein [Burkholderia territorii]|uniref:hypothetical protein n=1 Tax=Burkholderia territorii TaxID=1503055 RepID=UPI000ADF1173|nr:hypothetical protein [Burkholderia territorii]
MFSWLIGDSQALLVASMKLAMVGRSSMFDAFGIAQAFCKTEVRRIPFCARASVGIFPD